MNAELTEPPRASFDASETDRVSIDETIDHPSTRIDEPETPAASDEEDQGPWGGLTGQVLAQYQLEERLGQGSMARVYRARHLGLGRVCALKIMDPSLIARKPEHREQFWAEARSAANLIHQHVVTIHNIGSDQGFDFIEMEYVPGALSLRDYLIQNGPFEAIAAARLVRQVALALHAAHSSGVIHRDVKPANVLLTAQGHAKLADFGLARRIPRMASARLAGTPTFMAPELFRGSIASAQSDIYAVGVMLFYLVSGRLPYSASGLRSLIQLHQAPRIPKLAEIVPGVPPSLVRIIERSLAKNPRERYATSLHLADELRLLAQGLRDTESLLRESLHGVDCFFQGTRENFRIVLPQKGGERLQEVFVEVNQTKSNERFLSVFSVCGPADPSHYAGALELNAQLTYGSLSIRHVLGSPMFVMSRTFPRDRVRPSEIRAAVLEIARRSDQIEQQLTSLDLY